MPRDEIDSTRRFSQKLRATRLVSANRVRARWNQRRESVRFAGAIDIGGSDPMTIVQVQNSTSTETD